MSKTREEILDGVIDCVRRTYGIPFWEKVTEESSYDLSEDLVDNLDLAGLRNALVAHFGIPRFNSRIFDLEHKKMGEIADFVQEQLTAQGR